MNVINMLSIPEETRNVNRLSDTCSRKAKKGKVYKFKSVLKNYTCKENTKESEISKEELKNKGEIHNDVNDKYIENQKDVKRENETISINNLEVQNEEECVIVPNLQLVFVENYIKENEVPKDVEKQDETLFISVKESSINSECLLTSYINKEDAYEIGSIHQIENNNSLKSISNTEILQKKVFEESQEKTVSKIFQSEILPLEINRKESVSNKSSANGDKEKSYSFDKYENHIYLKSEIKEVENNTTKENSRSISKDEFSIPKKITQSKEDNMLDNICTNDSINFKNNDKNSNTVSLNIKNSYTNDGSTVFKEESIIQQMTESIEVNKMDNGNSITVKLKPEYLGEMTINIQNTANGCIAKISTELDEVKKVIASRVNDVSSILSQKMLRVDQIIVETIPKDGYQNSFSNSQQNGQEHNNNNGMLGQGFSQKNEQNGRTLVYNSMMDNKVVEVDEQKVEQLIKGIGINLYV